MLPNDHTVLLDVNKLSVLFHGIGKHFFAVHDLSFSLASGEIFALVGESGCGKSLAARALLRLPPKNATLSGSVIFQGENLLTVSEESMRYVRGHQIAMIFQEPMTALNPVLTVGSQALEVLTTHSALRTQEAKERVIAMFSQVGIPNAEERYASYPHQLSGGMRQRVMIAMSLLCDPKLLLADEPTTALDATISQQIMDLILEESRSRGMAVLFISHNLDMVESFADHVGVMYAGRLVECAPRQDLFAHPRHPYTQGLLAASFSRLSQGATRVPTIAGAVPRLEEIPSACPFAPRCSRAEEMCLLEFPPLHKNGEHHWYCWL